jgi:hypothetical protein
MRGDAFRYYFQPYSNSTPTLSRNRHFTRHGLVFCAVFERRKTEAIRTSRVARKISLAPLAEASATVHEIKLSIPQHLLDEGANATDEVAGSIAVLDMASRACRTSSRLGGGRQIPWISVL